MSTVGWIVIGILAALLALFIYLFMAASHRISELEESEDFKQMVEELKQKEDDSSWF